jgi:hypothetical protein
MRMLAPFLALALALGAVSPSAAKPAPRPVRPVVVELYTAQGCEACTKANGLADELAQRGGVLPLTFSVDYWDYLGWSDTFAKPEFTARQRAYMRPLGQRDVYTPQVVVDGRAQAPGTRTDRVNALVAEAAKARGTSPPIRFYGGDFVRIEAGTAPRGGTDIWMVRYEPQPEAVEVTSGETRGQTLAYANVVRELVRIGGWTGKRRTFAIPKASTPGLKTAILMQGAKGGRILAVLER